MSRRKLAPLATRGMSIFETHAGFLDATDHVKFGGRFENTGGAIDDASTPGA